MSRGDPEKNRKLFSGKAEGEEGVRESEIRKNTFRKVVKLRLKHVMKNPELLSGVDAFPALLGEKKSFLRSAFEFEQSLFQSRSLLRRNRLPGKNPAEDPEEIPDDIHMQI